MTSMEDDEAGRRHSEFVPLDDPPEGRAHRYISLQRQGGGWGRRRKLKGPLRAAKLLLLIVLMPTLFIAVPIYMKLYVYGGQFYPVGMTDMRLIDRKVSTAWCQSQMVRSNATFNAFLLPEKPKLSNILVPVSMTRELSLDDDMKEYWGFYLLEGSIVTVSTCVRWPGASLIMIRGHKHLQECAYIGDDSSEELEEILEAGDLGDVKMMERLRKLLEDSPANQPDAMRRHDSAVLFHDPAHVDQSQEKQNLNHKQRGTDLDIGDNDPEELKEILDKLQAIKEAKKNRPPWRKPHNIISVPQLVNRHRETQININEKQWFSFQELVQKRNNTRSRMNKIIDKLMKHGVGSLKGELNYHEEMINDDELDYHKDTPNRSDETFSENNRRSKQIIVTDAQTMSDVVTNSEPFNKEHYESTAVPETQISNENTQEETVTESSEGYSTDKVLKGDIEDNVEKTPHDLDKVYDEVYKRLSDLGDKGERVLNRLRMEIPKRKIGKKKFEISTSTTRPLTEHEDDAKEQRLKVLRDIILEVILERENENKGKLQKEERMKREIVIKQMLEKSLNEDDEKGNAAIEDVFIPDGIADHHQIVNETTLGDMSNSEFWSSFSSSEEALLECAGLILNLPLTPHTSCKRGGSVDDMSRASLPNAVTYRVPTNGYYFFVFNSENEVQTNYIRVRFDLQKTIYDLSELLMECKNSTGNCSLPLGFLSGEKVVLEVPLRDNDSLWNEQFVVLSECQPRTSVYVFCAVAVPLLILLFGLQ